MSAAALDAATLEKIVSAAVAAPSLHNTQPWRYRLDPGTTTIEVHAAPERSLPRTDPEGRALHLSIGAALFNLRTAVSHFGWEPVVRTLPRPADPGLLAAVHLAGPRAGRPRQLPDLYAAIGERHSSRSPFTGPSVPPDVQAELARAAAAEGARLAFPSRAETTRILRLTADADRRTAADPGRGSESRAWVRRDSPDGLPETALGPHDTTGHVPVRDFAGPHPAGRPGQAAFEAHPLIGVLSTPGDAPADWLRAGQALEHALLAATARGVRASLLGQAVEWADLRWALRDPRGGCAHVHMLIRFGHGPQGPATPRRPAGEVLDTGREDRGGRKDREGREGRR